MLFILLAGKQRRDVERLIADQRERARCVHRHRRQYRIDVLLKVTVHVRRLLSRQFLVFFNNVYSVGCHQRNEGAVIRVVLALDEFSGRRVDPVELLRCRHARNIPLAVVRMYHIL